MLFIDGETLSIRLGSMLRTRNIGPDVSYEPDLYVWTKAPWQANHDLHCL